MSASPGDVEEDGLEEEGEADPLVVLVVVLVLGVVLVRRGYARVRHHRAHRRVHTVRDGEGGVDPAVGVHNLDIVDVDSVDIDI